MRESRPTTEPGEVTGLKSLSKRITRRTFDLTAFAIVAIGLVTLGIRLAGWWQAGNDAAATAAVSSQAQLPWGVGAEGALLAFGDADWSARHLTLLGKADDVRQQLVAECADRLREGTDLSELQEPTNEEADLISRLTAHAPADEGEGWKVYVLDGPLMAAFGVAADSNAEGAAPRIVYWGLALPAGMASLAPVEGESSEEELPLWSAWMIDPAGTTVAAAGPTVPAPPGGSRVMSIRDPLAGGIETFRGVGTVNEWQAFFGDWLEECGVDNAAWGRDEGRVQTSAVIQHDGQSWRCDIILAEDTAGEIECLVNLVEVQ